MTVRRVRIAELESRMRALAADLDRLKNWPDEPFGDHSVIKFTKRFHGGGGASYIYAAIKANGRWYLTGKANSGNTVSKTWEELCEFAGDGLDTMVLCTSWESLEVSS
jgi:hypothetical protein